MMQMAEIMTCSATDCAYNMEKQCHALAVTIGDVTSPRCDTEFMASMKGGKEDVTAGVGACKVMNCVYNDSLECAAGCIDLEMQDGHAQCCTFIEK